MLELKIKGISEQTRTVVRHSRFRSPLIYASFAAEEMRVIRIADPSATTMVLMDTLPRNPVTHALRVSATHAGLRFITVTRPLVQAFHDAGLRVFVYTVNEPADIQRVRSFGVDGIISDFPDRT
jgi:glycerophosphoryl diester phosphodiesterase